MVDSSNGTRDGWSRRSFSLAFASGALGLLSACATSKVKTERDDAYDFNAPKTYAWVTDDLILIQFGKDQPRVRTRENELRVRAAIERELGSRGMTKVDKADADVLVAFSVGVRMRYRVEGGDSTSVWTETPGEKKTKGQLNFYMLDRATEREVWHGWTSKWLNATDDPDTIVNNAVAKILAAYPN